MMPYGFADAVGRGIQGINKAIPATKPFDVAAKGQDFSNGDLSAKGFLTFASGRLFAV